MANGYRVLIVADDLTGAMDAAGPFAQSGRATWVVAEPLECDPSPLAEAEVVSLNTASRHLPPEQAAQRVTRCAKRFSADGFDAVFKKVDSTLRGNVAAETLALMQAASRRSALVAPAFPAQKRTMRSGVVHVDGVPLRDTGFARDALSPPPLDPLHVVFGQAAEDMPVVAWSAGRPGVLRHDSIIVADAQRDADLDGALDAVHARLEDVLLVGSAGLGQALARRMPAAALTHRPTTVSGPIVFVVGSRAMQSRQQVEQLAMQADTVVLDAPNGKLAAVPDCNGAKQVVLRAVTDAVGGEGDALRVSHDLAGGALALVRDLDARAVVATGGDTAIALLAATGSPALHVLGDLMPGIPFARLQIDGKPVWLITKAGGFGGPSTFIDVARRLRADATHLNTMREAR
jgi:D-threonate/D-erythronate kinase